MYYRMINRWKIWDKQMGNIKGGNKKKWGFNEMVQQKFNRNYKNKEERESRTDNIGRDNDWKISILKTPEPFALKIYTYQEHLSRINKTNPHLILSQKNCRIWNRKRKSQMQTTGRQYNDIGDFSSSSRCPKCIQVPKPTLGQQWKYCHKFMQWNCGPQEIVVIEQTNIYGIYPVFK